MKVLVVYTHPYEKSLNASFLDKTLSGLKVNKNVETVEVLDLYGENFNPVLTFGDVHRRRDLHKRNDMENFRDQFTGADVVVFIYPIWWGRPPAMLLGYIDRLLVSGFAYETPEGKTLPVGLLKGKKVICISTMKGPNGYIRLFLGNAHKNLMKKAVFNFVGIRNLRFFEFGSMEKNEGKQKDYLGKIEKYMSTLSA